MSRAERRDAGPQFAAYVARHFQPHGLVHDLSLVAVSQDGAILRVVFDGRPEVREGRFGVRIPTPEAIGDERWFDFPVEIDDPPEEWVKMAVILDLLEVYDTTAPSCHSPADADGIIWLS